MREPVRFRPSRADGPDRLEVLGAGSWRAFPLRSVARRGPGLLERILDRLRGVAPACPFVADRDSFHAPAERSFAWYTEPPLVTCMPTDEPAAAFTGTVHAIQAVLDAGGCWTADLG